MDLRANLSPKITVPFGSEQYLPHSVMLGIIHDALTGKIENNSPISDAIKTRLLPVIARKLAEKSRQAKLNFAGKTLQQSMLQIVKSAPIDKLPQAEHLDLIRVQKSNANEMNAAVENCDLYHLLRDICTPALCEILNSDENIQLAVKNVLGIDSKRYLASLMDDDIDCYAILPKDTSVGKIMHKRMDDFNAKKWELNDLEYPWSNHSNILPFTRQPIKFDDVADSIKNIQQLISKNKAVTSTSIEYEIEILKAAEEGYKDALQHTFFGGNESQINAAKQNELAAILIQNTDIENFVSAAKRKNR